MSNPEEQFDRSHLVELTSAIMDGTATQDEQQALTELLRTNAAARDAYLMLADMHALLSVDLPVNTTAEGKPKVPAPQAAEVKPLSKTRRMVLAVGVIAAVAVLLVAGLPRFVDQPDTAAGSTFVTVVQETGAEWSSQRLEVGQRFGKEIIRLTDGVLKLQFDSGVEVILQGPAQFELVSFENTKLESGVLTATVPPGAEGFTVDTPDAEVVDLGTSFGIDLREVGYSNVSVFDGEVEVLLRDVASKRLLTEGESVRISSDQKIEDVDFDPHLFEKLWPAFSGIVGSSEPFRFIPPWPKRIRFVHSDTAIFVATEGDTVELVKPLDVNISEAGEYLAASDLTPTTLSPGLQVRSYILHFSPTENRGPRRARRIKGSITFERPVLGLIVQHEELMSSMRRFARRSAGEQQPRRQLEFTGGNNGDRVLLSEDQRTLTVDLVSPGRNTDLVRVIVDQSNKSPSHPLVEN